MAVRLADLKKPLPPVVIPATGAERRVVKVNGAVAQLREEYAKSEDPKLLWEIVGHLLPDATKDEVLSLDVEDCAAVIAIASGTADAILAEMEAENKAEREAGGNAKAPAAEKPQGRRRKTS